MNHSRALLIDAARAALVYLTPEADCPIDRAAAAESAILQIDKVTAFVLRAGLIACPTDDLAKQITALRDAIQCEGAALASAARFEN